ncbi:MAG: ABC transporter substrate-binding (seleno)protein SaoB [Clostridium sp.]|uniref:ABC transporter substrate-binding (seleno)protein SaoB n=1 Tax=Clostridium sp. TaxID=1506 RepID=UPI002FC82941
MSSDAADIAIICSSLAKEFLKDNNEFVEVGDVVMNADILVGSKNPAKIGVPQNRVDKYELLMKKFGKDIDIKPIKSTTLPYVLEKGEVDAILVDAYVAVGLDNIMEGTNHIQGDYPSYTMISTKKFYESEEFQEFKSMYNKGVDELKNDNFLNTYLLKRGKSSERRVDKWRKWHVTIQKLP